MTRTIPVTVKAPESGTNGAVPLRLVAPCIEGFLLHGRQQPRDHVRGSLPASLALLPQEVVVHVFVLSCKELLLA